MATRKSTTVLPRRPRDPAFGARLRSGRVGAGLSQRALAARAGVTAAAISTFEKGRIPGDPRVAMELARILGVAPDWLLTGRSAAGHVRRKPGYVTGRSGAAYAGVPADTDWKSVAGDARAVLEWGRPELVRAMKASLRAFAQAARRTRRG